MHPSHREMCRAWAKRLTGGLPTPKRGGYLMRRRRDRKSREPSVLVSGPSRGDGGRPGQAPVRALSRYPAAEAPWPVVQPDFLGDFAVLDAQDGGFRKVHLPG